MTTPTPPPGYRLLTPEELTKPLPMDAVCFPKYGKDGMWSQSGYRGGFPDERARTEFFYATATPPPTDWRKLVEELAAHLERQLEEVRFALASDDDSEASIVHCADIAAKAALTRADEALNNQ